MSGGTPDSAEQPRLPGKLVQRLCLKLAPPSHNSNAVASVSRGDQNPVDPLPLQRLASASCEGIKVHEFRGQT